MPSFFSKLLGKKKHSDNSGLLDGERYEAIPADIPPPPPSSGPVSENIPPTKSSPHKSKSHGLGLHLKRRAQSPPPPPPTEREPIAPAPHLSLDLPSSQAEEKQPTDLKLGLGNENLTFNDAILRQKRLTPAETLYLVQKTSEIIQERGLEVLGVMRPHWFASPNHQEAQLKLLNCFLQSLAVRSSNEGASSSMASEDPFENELRYTRDPHDVAAVFRWGLRHLQLENNAFALTTIENWYQTFVTSERSEGYSSQAFDRILPPLLPATHVHLIRSVLDLLTSLAAHSEENGISGNKLSKALGWWLISPRNVAKQPQWPSFYSDWEVAARQFEHLFLAYIRIQESQSRMPKRLTELVKNYPFEKSRKSEDGIFLPRPRFSTRSTDALFIRIAVQADSEGSNIHPLRIVINSLNSLPDKDASGDYLAIWESIREAAKTNTEEENQDTPPARFNLSAVIADESLRLLSLIPGMNDIPDVSVFPSHTSQRSFSLIERPLSLASTFDQRSPADKANSISMPNTDLEHVTDWQAFSTTGFRSPSGISLTASLWDNDVEVTMPSVRRSNTKHTFSSNSEPPLPEEPTTPPLQSPLAAVEQATMPVEVSNSRTATFSSPSLVKLDEAFVDFWADTLLDSVGQSWPTFVVCQLKPMPNLKVKDTTKSIEWIVIEQVVAAPVAPVAPVQEDEPEPLPPVPSTPPKSDSHKSHGFFSFTSPTRKRWGLFSSKQDTAPLLGRRRSGSKVSEMGEVLKEEDEMPKPPSDVSMTTPQSEESSSAVASIPKPESLEPVAELPKTDGLTSEEHPKTDHLSPIPEDVKLEEATAMDTVIEEPAGSEAAIPENLPPVPPKVEVEEVGPELPSKEKELPEPAVQENETLSDSRAESDGVVVDDAVPLGESAVIVPKPEEKALPEIDESERATETPVALESIPATEEPAVVQGDVQEEPGESVPEQEISGEIPTVSDLDSKVVVPAEINSAKVVADEGSREPAVPSADEGLKVDTDPAPRSEMSVSVVEPTPIEEFGASIMSPVTAEPVIKPIREEDERDALEAEKEGDSQGFEFVQESEPTEAEVIEESGETVAPTEEVPSETPQVLEPVMSRDVVDVPEVPEEPSSVSNQQVEEINKGDSPKETLLLDETVPTEGSQTIVPELSREKEAHVEGTADEASRLGNLEETLKTGIAAPEVSTDTSIPIATTEEVTPGPPPVEETPITRDAPGEVTPAQETPLPDEPSAVSAEVPGEVSSIVNEEKDRNDGVSASVQSSMPEAGPVTEILPSESAATVEEPHIHENYIPTEEETARVDTSAVETAPGAETTDILSSKDALVSPVDKEASGEQTPNIKSAVEQSIPAVVVGTSLVSALEDQQPNNLEVTRAEETSTVEEKPVEDVAAENPNRGLLSDEAEKIPFTEESLENVDVEDTTTTGVPIVDRTTVLQIPVIDSSEESPAAPVAEVVSVPKVAIIDEEEPPRSEAAAHAPAADADEDEVPDQSIPKDEEPIPIQEAVPSEDVAFATTPITTVPEVTEEVPALASADNTVFGIQANEKVSDSEADVEPAGTEAKSPDVKTSNDEELHVEDATIPATDAPAQKGSVTVDGFTQSTSIEQKPLSSYSSPEEAFVAEEPVQSPEASVERSAVEAATIGQGAAAESPSTEMINTEESSDPTPEPAETTPSDVPEPVESEPAETHKSPVPESDSLQESAAPPEQRYGEQQVEPSVNEKTEPDITSEAQADGTQVQEAHDDLVAEPENEPSSLLQHDSSALAAVSIPLGDTQTQSTDGLPRSDAVVPEKAEAVAEPVTQTQDIAVPRENVIVEPAAQVEDSSKPDVEPEVGTGDELAQFAQPSDEAQVAESKEPAADTSSAVVSQDPPIEEVVAEPVATGDTSVVGNETNDLAQSIESSTAPKGETESVLDLGPQAETTEPEIADEASAEPEIVSDQTQSIGEVQPEPTNPVSHGEPPEAETAEATPVLDTEVVEPSEVIGQDAAPEALEPSTADRTDIVVGSQEVPAHSSVPEALPASEELGISQDLNENIETQGANQVEGSTAVHPAVVVDSDESQAVEPTGDQTVSAVDNSQTEFPSENVETVETPMLSSNIPIPEETALSNPIHEGDIAPSVEPPSEEVQPSLAAKNTSSPDPSDLATNTIVHADSISHEDSSANATAEASLQFVQAGLDIPEQSITSPSTQHISDPAITSESFPQTIEDTTPSVNDVAATQDTIPSDHDVITDVKVESVQEPTVVAAVEPEGTTSVEPESSITKNLTVEVPEVEEIQPIDTQPVVEADQEPPTDNAPATIEPISEPKPHVAPTTEHQDTATLPLVTAEAEPLAGAVDSRGADSEAPTLAEQAIEGTSEPGAHDSTQLDTFSTDTTPVAVPEHILAEDSSVPIPAEVEEITQFVETHQEEPPTRDDAAPDTEPIPELEAHATAATEHQDPAHLSFATVDDQPPAAEHSINYLRADTEARVVSDQDGDFTEAAHAQTYSSSVQPDSFSSNVELEPAVRGEESASEPPAEPSGDAPVATDAQPIPSENVEAGGRAALEDIPSSTDVEATGLDSGINGNNAEVLDGGALEEQPFDAVEAKSVPVDLDDTKTVSNEHPEPNVAPIDEASVPEPPSAVNETPEQVNPSSVAETATALSSSQEPEVRAPQAEEHASEDKATAADTSSSTRLADNESPEGSAEEQNEADSIAQHVQSLESDSIPEVIVSQTESQVEPTGLPQSGSAKEYIPTSEELVAQSEDKPEVPQSDDSEPAIQVDDVQEGSTRTLDDMPEQQPEITQVESASNEVSSPSQFPETPVESQELLAVNGQSKSQLQYDQSALVEDTVPPESMRTQSTEELPTGDVVAAEEMDQAQDTDSNAIARSAVQEQETFESKLDPDTTEVEQQTSEEPIQSSDKVREAETKEPSPPAASEESQAKDVFTATDEIAPTTEVPGEVDEPEAPVNTAGTGLEDVGPEPDVTEPAGAAEEAKQEPEAVSDEVQENGKAQAESTNIAAQVDAHPAEATPVHDNEMVESEPTRSIEQYMTPIDVSEPPVSNRADVAFQGVQAPVSHDELVQPSASEDVSFASEVPAKDQSGDIGTDTATSALPSIIVDSTESRAVEPTEDRALPATEDVEAKSSSANVETADALAPNVSDGEAVSQPVQPNVTVPSTEPVADEVQRSSVAKDDSTSELSVEAVNSAVKVSAVDEDLDANVKASDASALDSSIPNLEEVVSQSNHELEAPATEDSQSEPPLAANIKAVDTPASNLNIPVSEEAVSQPVQTDVPVPSVELPDEVQPSLTVNDPSVPDQSESIIHADPAVDENPSANVEAEVTSQSVQADTAAPDQSIPVPSTQDVADPAISAESPASDTNPDTAPKTEPEGTTSKELRPSEDFLVPAQEDDEIAQSEAPVETRQDLPAEADLPSANVEPSSEPEPEAHAAPATEHQDKVLSSSVVIPTNVKPEVADYRTVDDSEALLENVGTTGAAAADEAHGSFVQQPDALSSNVESEPVAMETQQESMSEPAAGLSNEVPVTTDPEPISSEAEDKVVSRDIPGSTDVEAEGQPLDLDVSKTEVAVEGPDNVAPSNGIAGTNGMIMNGGNVDAGTEGDNSENTSANQDQEDHIVSLDNGVDSGVLKDVPVEGVRSLDEASKERGLEFPSEGARQEELEDNRRETLF